MKVPEDAPRSGRKRRMPPRRGPEVPVPLWDPPSALDPMGRLELQGKMLRDAKRRLHDPRTPRTVRWASRIMLGMVLGPFVLAFVVLLVAQVAGLF